MRERKVTFTFEEILEQNERRIHYHIHRLNIRDPHRDFYQEGLFALWNAYETYQPDKGPMATYFNYMIRNRLIDLIRKETSENEKKKKIIQENNVQCYDGNRVRAADGHYPIFNVKDFLMEDEQLWQRLKTELTENQWKWVSYHIIDGMTLKAIAIQEKTSLEAVKSWGKQVRKKLRNKAFREKIEWDINF